MTFTVNGTTSTTSPIPGSACAPSCGTLAASASRRAVTRRLRRLHGLGRRRAGAQLPDAGVPRGGRKSRRSKASAQPTTCTRCSRSSSRAGVPVRLLHCRDDHDGGDVH